MRSIIKKETWKIELESYIFGMFVYIGCPSRVINAKNYVFYFTFSYTKIICFI